MSSRDIRGPAAPLLPHCTVAIPPFVRHKYVCRFRDGSSLTGKSFVIMSPMLLSEFKVAHTNVAVVGFYL